MPWVLNMFCLHWFACPIQVGVCTRNRLSEIWGWPLLQNLALAELTVSHSPLPLWDIRDQDIKKIDGEIRIDHTVTLEPQALEQYGD
jgi:hypothetical protein